MTDIATILTPQNYKPKTEIPSVFNLICIDPTTLTLACSSGLVGGDGVFYYASHGGFVGDGTPTAPLRFGIWTTTKYDPYLNQNVLPTSDVFGTANAPSTLIKIVAEAGGKDYETHYAITASFVRKYFQDFSNNSFIYLDACSSDDPRTGPDSAQDFKQAFFDKNASVYAGWTATASDDIAANSARLVFDRLLGANVLFPETGPPQRPFPWPSLPDANGDLLKHSLGADPDTGAFLEFTPNPEASTSVFGLLAPSISFMEISDGAPLNLDIRGVFGSDPVNGGVLVGGSDPELPAQTNTAGGVDLFPCDWTMLQGFGISCVLPFTGTGAYGNVQVSVRGHNSNVARITEWQGPFTFNFVNIPGPQEAFDSLATTITLNTAFRADIRSFRRAIHEDPGPPVTAGFELIPPFSSGPYSCSGAAQNVMPNPPLPPIISDYSWTGSGSLTAYDPSSGFPPPRNISSPVEY